LSGAARVGRRIGIHHAQDDMACFVKWWNAFFSRLPR